ncbi:hypothetical protein B0H14DRAFT_1358541 [Mycena olivaceomarginata]|nr:hypothetical protein B0H14DRAFT_1358541 [Mycena olivaceomarginata]
MPYHTHALSTRPPCTSYTTGRRRCPSSTRAPTGTTTIFSGDTPGRPPRAPARTRTHTAPGMCNTNRCVHSPSIPQSHIPLSSPPAAAPTTIRTTTRVRSACGRCSSSPAPSYGRLRRCPSASPGCRRHRTTSARPTPCLRTLEPDARRHRHVQCSMPSASETPRSNRRGCATSLRGAATVRPPYGTSHRATNPLLRDCDTTSCALERSRRRTTPTHSTPCRRAPQLGSIPLVARAACDDEFAFPVPTSPSSRPRCATVYRPHHSMAAPAAFFSTTRNTPRVCSARHGRSSSPALSSSPSHAPPPSTVSTARHAAACIPNTTPTSTAPAAAALHRARRVRRLPARPALPQRRPNPPLKTRPGTHHEHDVHAMHVACPCPVTVFSAAPPSAQRQVLSRSASMPCTTAYAARAAAVLHHPTPFRRVPARTHHLQRRSTLTARLTAGTDLGTVPSTTCVRHGHSPPSLLRPWHPTTVQILSAILSTAQHPRLL